MAKSSHDEAAKHLERSTLTSSDQHDFRLRRKDGSHLYALISTGRMRDDSGQVIGALVMVVDITERKRADEALAHERGLLQGLMDNVPDSIYTHRQKRAEEIAKEVVDAARDFCGDHPPSDDITVVIVKVEG